MKILSSILLCFLVGCSYRFGSEGKKIPGGYTLVAVPIFQNKTKTVGIENFFTRSMIEEIENSRIARVIDKEESQVIVEGQIDSVEVIRGTELTKDSGVSFEKIPEGVALSKEYRVVVRISVQLRKTSDASVIWSGKFSGERRYPAAIVTQRVISTVNPLYNHSAQTQNIKVLAKDVMAEAYDQMTENF